MRRENNICMNLRRAWLRFALWSVPAAAIALACFGQSASSATAPPAARAAAQTLATTQTNVESVVDLVNKRNPGMKSYKAHAHLDLRQVNFPYLHPVLDGHEYVSSPGYTVFDYPHTPFYLKGITKVQGAFGNADRWLRCYNITMAQQTDTFALHMVPKIEGEITAVDVLLSHDGEISHVDWYYRENPNDHIRLTQTYGTVNGYSVVTSQVTEVTLRHIRALGTQTFGEFEFNVPVPTPTPTPSDPLHACDN